MKPSDFKVGDRVRIVRCVQKKNQYLVGKEGIVSHYVPDSYWCWIHIDGCPLEEPHSKDGSWNFNYSQLKLISPQSPQPQQTQQKEDNMYGVITFTHTNNGSTLVAKTTEAEAKAFAEQQVAAYRSNVQVKQYFSISIVDMRTGKFVGSVVDAPPAVDWS